MTTDTDTWVFDQIAAPDSSFVVRVYANYDDNQLLWILADSFGTGYLYDLGSSDSSDSAREIMTSIGRGESAGKIFAQRKGWKFLGFIEEDTADRREEQETAATIQFDFDTSDLTSVSKRIENAFERLKGLAGSRAETELPVAVVASADTNIISLIITDSNGEIEQSVKVARDTDFHISVQDGRIAVNYSN